MTRWMDDWHLDNRLLHNGQISLTPDEQLAILTELKLLRAYANAIGGLEENAAWMAWDRAGCKAEEGE